MANIEVSGRTKVKSFYNAFLKAYPYLIPALKYPDGKSVDVESSIANARGKSKGGDYTPTGEAALSVAGHLNIGTFEKRFKEIFSINCKVAFKRNGKWADTGAKYDGMTLNEANTLLKNEGADIIKL
jgi:hypothetical protein